MITLDNGGDEMRQIGSSLSALMTPTESGTRTRNISVRPNISSNGVTFDAFSLQVRNSMVDHVTATWFTDEGISETDAENLHLVAVPEPTALGATLLSAACLLRRVRLSR